MLSGHNILCFPPNRWEGLWRNRQQIMSRLAAHNRILYIHAPPDLRHLAAYRRRPRALFAGPRLSSPLPNLWVYEPPRYAPRSGRAPLRQITFWLRLASLRRTLRRLQMADPILWLFSYEWRDYLGRLGEKLAIYHAVDDYSAYELEYAGPAAAEHRRRIQQLEAETIAGVDLVFVTSAPLLAAKQPLHPHVILVENGVDYAHFAAAAAFPPAQIAALPRPRIVYAGAVNEKLDLTLLHTLAERFPHASFILIGPDALRYDRAQLAQVQALPNIHFLGHKPVADLPAYLHACDLCLIPYKRNEWTRHISPLKLYEYLATGLPILSTDIPAARAFAGLIWLADSAEAFIAALPAALQADSPDRRRRQQAIARQHTWENRIEALSAAISHRLDSSPILP
ncbi:MAG: glycosyltransferase [Caldilineales bacterium]|nr:glycosyltransferase [Caldilineales bacterium]